jgi:chromosome segregation ATPase
MQERINDLRKSLPHAEHEEQTAPQLERAIATARTRLVDAIGSRDDAGQNLDQVEQRLSEAHGLVDAEIDRVHGLAELNAKRESLRADAFVKGHPVDRDRMTRLDAKVSEVESQIEAAREHAEGARAAISTLEGLVDRAAATLERAKQQVHEAEQAVYVAVRAQAVRRFNTQVLGMRDTLLTLEAVDGELGVKLCAALHDRGLHTVTIDGQLAKPEWLHPVTQRPDSYRAAVAAEKAHIVQGENAEI